MRRRVQHRWPRPRGRMSTIGVEVQCAGSMTVRPMDAMCLSTRRLSTTCLSTIAPLSSNRATHVVVAWPRASLELVASHDPLLRIIPRCLRP